MFIYSGVHWDLNLLCGVDLCQVSAPLWAMRFELDVFPPLRTWDCQVQGVMEVQCQRVAWCTCVCVCVCVRVCVLLGMRIHVSFCTGWMELLLPETPKSIETESCGNHFSVWENLGGRQGDQSVGDKG